MVNQPQVAMFISKLLLYQKLNIGICDHFEDVHQRGEDVTLDNQHSVAKWQKNMFDPEALRVPHFSDQKKNTNSSTFQMCPCSLSWILKCLQPASEDLNVGIINLCLNQSLPQYWVQRVIGWLTG